MQRPAERCDRCAMSCSLRPVLLDLEEAVDLQDHRIVRERLAKTLKRFTRCFERHL